MTTFIAPIRIQISAVKIPTTISNKIVIAISPITEQSQTTVEYDLALNTNPIEINISEPLITSAYEFLREAIQNYIDEERELKTLLNYGEDRQSVILAKRYGATQGTVQLKLLQPVPNEIDINTTTFLSREVVKTLIDKVRVRFAPVLDATPYLRPRNSYVKADLDSGKSLKNVTIRLLSLESGSRGAKDGYQNFTFEDQIFRRWYSYDFNSAELNIDFTDYNNFIFYGSAKMRLAAFQEKLKLLENIELKRLQFVTSSITGSEALLGRVYLQEQSADFAKQKEDIIRNFDRYEQYLYFTPSGSNSPYTASAYYADEEFEYNPIGYWPKDISGSLYSPYAAESIAWYTTQSAIAQRFDDFNENNIINTIPTHVREDEESAAYITFVAMVGHFFDLIKPYVDQMPYIYNRNIDPNTGLSKDLVANIAEAVGFKLPTLYSVYSLSDDILGTADESSRRDFTVETYKRLLHNLPFFAKAKGTRSALQTFLRSFGITPQLLDVKESGTPTTSSYYVFDEFSTGLDFDEGSSNYIILPISASRRNPKSIQFNLTVAKNKSMTVLNGDDKWALNVAVHPSSSDYGRFEIVSGSTVILSSSYEQIFGDELLSIAIRTYDTGSYANLFVTQVYGEDVLFTSTMSEPTNANVFVPLWSSSNEMYIGGSGSLVVSNFDGTIDEVRLWGINLSNEMTINNAFDPGSSAGDTYQDAVDYLYAQLSFNLINTASLPLLPNESPYKNISAFPNLTSIGSSNTTTADLIRYSRTVRQLVSEAGSTGYLTNKIVVKTPAVFNLDSIDKHGVKTLSRTKSIVAPETKRIQRGRNKVILTTSPTEIINQNIVRNLGLENINAVLGAPSDLYNNFTTSLKSLRSYYEQYYYVSVNFNRYIRILSEVGSVIDQVVGYFIPSKATLLKGIVIEPNILEQTKIPPIKNLRFYGAGTRKTLGAKGSLTGSKADYGATFNLSKTIELIDDTTVLGKNNTHMTELESYDLVELVGKKTNFTGQVTSSLISIKSDKENYKGELELYNRQTTSGSYGTFKGIVEEQNPTTIQGKVPYYTGSVEEANTGTVRANYETYDIQHESWKDFISQSLKLKPKRKSRIDTEITKLNKISYNSTNKGSEGAEPYNRIYPRKLTESEFTRITSHEGPILYQQALYDIPPSTDFRDVGVYTYFSQPEGIYYFPETIKIPAYRQPINFAAATSWSYGTRYNMYDVVYQDVTTDNIELGTLTGAARAGNGRYYVFTTRPSYVSSSDGSAFYSGSVPSYIPPSLDKANWDLLRFTPIERRVPRRIVFDTFTITDPALNNYRVTTIDINKIIDIPDRYVDSFDVASVAGNSYATGQIALQNIAAFFAAQSNNTNIRLRLYRTANNRDADITRTIDTRPTGNHGVLLDMFFDQSGTAKFINPITTVVADENPPSGITFYTIDNLDSTPKSSITILLFYFAIEIETRVPTGYLRKHYRFFRDNSTGTKRRNHLGCKFTITGYASDGTPVWDTIDGQPPVQVFLSEGTEVTVAPTISNTEIQTGGGGVLNVT